MITRRLWGLGVMIVVALGLIAAVQADNGGTLQVLIQDAISQNRTVIFTFSAPLAGGDTILSSDDYAIIAGTDYLCFGQAWNEGEIRQRCTPYSNLSSVSYLQQGGR